MWLPILVGRTAPSKTSWTAHFSGSGFPPKDKPSIIDQGGALPDPRPRGFNLRTSGTDHAPHKGGVPVAPPGLNHQGRVNYPPISSTTTTLMVCMLQGGRDGKDNKDVCNLIVYFVR